MRNTRNLMMRGLIAFAILAGLGAIAGVAHALTDSDTISAGADHGDLSKEAAIAPLALPGRHAKKKPHKKRFTRTKSGAYYDAKAKTFVSKADVAKSVGKSVDKLGKEEGPSMSGGGGGGSGKGSGKGKGKGNRPATRPSKRPDTPKEDALEIVGKYAGVASGILNQPAPKVSGVGAVGATDPLKEAHQQLAQQAANDLADSPLAQAGASFAEIKKVALSGLPLSGVSPDTVKILRELPSLVESAYREITGGGSSGGGGGSLSAAALDAIATAIQPLYATMVALPRSVSASFATSIPVGRIDALVKALNQVPGLSQIFLQKFPAYANAAYPTVSGFEIVQSAGALETAQDTGDTGALEADASLNGLDDLAGDDSERVDGRRVIRVE